MGITGLLPFLEKSSKKTNIGEFAGGTVAIDTYCWLHKGVFSCAEKIMMGQTTDAYIVYCMKYINMLTKHRIKPILVFDGRSLPAKELTEIKRRESRQMNRRKGIELMQMGQMAEGRNLLKRAIDITHEMALELIKHCQNLGIDCIVAPYEADAQLAYLNINGIADVVITEDSDLTIFGCKKILFKMDFNGNGVLIEQDRLHLAMDLRPDQFDMDKFRYICILSGCDYLPSLPGIGLGKARKFIARNTDGDIHRALTRVGSTLNMKSLVVTEEYRDAFVLADITFRYQLVFCPLRRKQVRLNSPNAGVTKEQLRYAGEESVDADLALQLALGNCDPATLKMLHNFNPDKTERKRKRDVLENGERNIRCSIWSSGHDVTARDRDGASVATSSPFPRQDCVRTRLQGGSIPNADEPSEDPSVNEGILDLYNVREDAKSQSDGRGVEEKTPERSRDETVEASSPESARRISNNPFVKRVSDHLSSPSVLSNGDCRRRGRNLMRIRRTVVDESAMVESRFFSGSAEDGAAAAAVKLERKKKDTETEERSGNRHDDDPELPANGHERLNHPPREEVDENHSPLQENRLTSSCLDLETKDTADGSLSDLSQWSAGKKTSCGTPSGKRTTNNRENSSILRANTLVKRTRSSKQSPSVSNQQNLLSMYGFQPRPTLKH